MKKAKDGILTLHVSYVGCVLGILFFGLSLTPSLLPRSAPLQAVISGISLSIGYALGVLLIWAWRYLGLPEVKQQWRAGVDRSVIALTIVVSVFYLWQFVGWQNESRTIFGMPTINAWSLIPIIVVALVVAYVIVVLCRSIRCLYRYITRQVSKVMPQRLSRLIGVILAAACIIFLLNGVLLRGLFATANQAFSLRDTTTDTGIAQPTEEERSGSPLSLVSWDSLGRQGRNFVGSGPSEEDLNSFSGGGAVTPIRVYAGLRSADSVQDRATPLLEELQRTGAFERDVLIIATTTGTGWLDPKAVDPLEYMYNGNSAIAGMQYSFLPSWISLLADQEKSIETSRTAFRTVHDYWVTLPENDRPELYLYGLSLGAFGAESVLNTVSIMNEPIDGALLAGTPFVSDLWAQITENRDAGSPAILPVYDAGRTVRFTARENSLNNPTGIWGNTKVIYLQHATDPVTFFSPGLAFTSPDWLIEGERGPDVAPSMRFIPIVTMWQVAGDLPAAGSTPDGFAHNYARASYIDTWAALTTPSNWSEEKSTALKQFVTDRY